ncbi:hypothetical protein [Moraxella lacunata]
MKPLLHKLSVAINQGFCFIKLIENYNKSKNLKYHHAFSIVWYDVIQ